LEKWPWTLVAPWLLSLGTALVGIWQFRAGQSQANKRPFLEQQLAISIEATDTVARLATETDPEEWDKARQAFWRLYWGRLALVEDRGVEARMVQFGRKRARLQSPAILLVGGDQRPLSGPDAFVAPLAVVSGGARSHKLRPAAA
jgi:hypothetical protein